MGRSLEVVSGSPKIQHSNLSVRCVDSCESSLRPEMERLDVPEPFYLRYESFWIFNSFGTLF